MDYTSNFNFKLLELGDKFDISDINSNFEEVDASFGQVLAAEKSAESFAESAAQSAENAAQTAATAAETVRAAAEETLNSIPEDYTKLSNNVVELKSDFNGMGVMKRYTVSGSDRIDIDGVTVPAGAEIYFRPVSAEKGRTGLILYGMYGDTNADGFDTLLNNAAFGKTYKLATSREYKKIRVVTYQFGGTEFAFDYLQTNSYGLQPDVSKLQSDVSDMQSDVSKLISDTDRTLSLFCDTEVTAEGSNNIPIEKNKTYRFYVTDMVNVGSLNFYLFAEDNTNVSYGNLRNKRFVEITTNDTSAFVRIWTDKQDTTTDLSYHVLAYVDADGSIEHRVANAENRISEYGLMNSFNRTTCKIFKRVVCCGDSYTSGHIQMAGETQAPTNEEFAWPHYMSTLTGNDWINCGCSGCNVLTWQTHARGLPTAQAKGKVQAYVIGLMINDVSNSDRAVELGSIDDIGTDAQTYYGGMSAIIRELNTISPNAKIFVNTCPKTGAKYTTYNQAVRDIVNAYKDTYPVHCIDLEAAKDLYNNASLTNDFVSGHYTAVGYEQFAEIYSYILSRYINENVTDFQDVYRIEYDS